MLSVAKIQIILKVCLLNFSVIFIHYSYLNINILASENQMIHIYDFKAIDHSLSIHSMSLSVSYDLNVRYK